MQEQKEPIEVSWVVVDTEVSANTKELKSHLQGH